MKRTKKIIMFIFTSWLIFQSWILIFSIYEQNTSWGDRESWCTESQILEPDEIRVRRSVIMVHGYGGSPYDYKPLAEELQKQGFYVTIPLMPDQGKKFFSYKRGQFTAQNYVDWLEEIIKEETKRFNAKPYLVGFSMGGTICTVVADNEKVDKLVLLAPFYGLPTAYKKLVAVNKVLRYVVPVLPKFAAGQIYSDEESKFYTPGSFLVSAGVFSQLAILVEIAKTKIPTLDTPTLIVGSTNDVVASFSIVYDLFANKKNVTIVDCPENNHILLYDHAKQKVIEETVSFLSKNEK